MPTRGGYYRKGERKERTNYKSDSKLIKNFNIQDLLQALAQIRKYDKDAFNQIVADEENDPTKTTLKTFKAKHKQNTRGKWFKFLKDVKSLRSPNETYHEFLKNMSKAYKALKYDL